MKRRLFAAHAFPRAILALFGCGELMAAPLIYEPFDYTAGDLNGKGAAANGFDGAWTDFAGSVNEVRPDGLQFGALDNHAGRVISINSADFTISQYERKVAVSIQSQIQSLPAVWVSVLVKKEGSGPVPRFDTFALNLFPSNASANRVSFGDVNLGNQFFGLSEVTNSGQTPSDTDVVVPLGNVVFLVAKLSFGTGAKAELFINPTPGSVEPGTAAATLSGLQFSSLDRIGYETGDDAGSQWSLDEIRLGATFADVAPAIPEPASAALLLIGAAALGGRRRRLSRG